MNYYIPLVQDNTTDETQKIIRNTVYTFRITGAGSVLEYQAQDWTTKNTSEIVFY